MALEIAKTENNERFVRALFNEKVLPLFGQADDWFSYDEFVTKLKERSMSHEMYNLHCTQPPDEVYHDTDGDDNSDSPVLSNEVLLESRKEMEEEIHATTGEAKESIV